MKLNSAYCWQRVIIYALAIRMVSFSEQMETSHPFYAVYQQRIFERPLPVKVPVFSNAVHRP